MTDNGLLERRLREADPTRTPRDAKPDAAALAMLEEIISGERQPPRPRARAASWAAVAAGAAAVGAVVFALLTPHGQAEAAGPDPLTFYGAGSVADVVEEAHRDLLAADGPAEAARTVQTISWDFHVDATKGEATVVPQLSTLRWEEDLSGRMTIIGGVPYDPADAGANLGAEVSSDGEVISDLVIEPGQFQTPIATLPGDPESGMREAMAGFGVPASPSAAEVAQGMGSILGQWTLTNAQEAVLIHMLATSDGVTALGDSTDRRGRPVSGLRAVRDDGAAADVVLISRETGRIVGMETTALKSDDIFSAGAIISYRLWDIAEEGTR